MATPDLNLLRVLDVLLAEHSVARAARRLRLSPSAMSRALSRLRRTVGDPLLVRAGRGLVATPRAAALAGRIGPLLESIDAVLHPVAAVEPHTLRRGFTLRTRDGFVESYGAALIARIAREAPGVRLCFVAKTDRDSAPLRDGSVDLDTGVVDASLAPELMTRALFRDRWIGLVRRGHPLARGTPTLARYAAGRHIQIARRGSELGGVDEAIAASGPQREIAAVVGGFASAVALARSSELIATVPERHTLGLREGMHAFPLPFATAPFTVSLIWHPRQDADPAHRWLRDCVRDVCTRSGDAAAGRRPREKVRARPPA